MTDDEFTEQCNALGHKLTETLFGAPKAVAICTMPGVMAAVAKTFGIPRETVIAMFDSALEDMQE
jgi:hypothetical protein